MCLQVYRKEVGSICGFKMFSDSILLSLLRKVSKLQHFGAPFRSYTLNQIYRVTLCCTVSVTLRNFEHQFWKWLGEREKLACVLIVNKAQFQHGLIFYFVFWFWIWLRVQIAEGGQAQFTHSITTFEFEFWILLSVTLLDGFHFC